MITFFVDVVSVSWYKNRLEHTTPKEGNHVNVPEQEIALKDDSDDVNAIGGADVSETTNTVKTAVKRTATKKST